MNKMRLILTFGIVIVLVAVIGIVCIYADSSATQQKEVVWYKAVYMNPETRSIGVSYYDYAELIPKLAKTKPAARSELLAIPTQTLQTLSTEGLLISCLDYPLFGDSMFYDNSDLWLTNLSQRYNGLNELLGRKDAGKVLVDFYSKVDLESVTKTDKYGSIRLRYLEAIIASNDILYNMDSDARLKLLNICVKNCKLISEEYQEEINPIAAARIAGKILYLDCPEFQALADRETVIGVFLSNMSVGEISDELWDEIVDCVTEFLA